MPFVFGRISTFCLNHDGWMFFLSWIVYISKDVDRAYVRGLDIPWQSLHYTLGSELIINDGQLLAGFYHLAIQYPLKFCKGVGSYDDDICG